MPLVVNSQYGLDAQPQDRWVRKLPVHVLERAAIRAELGIDDGTIVVRAVGRLVWEKGYADTARAALHVVANPLDVCSSE